MKPINKVIVTNLVIGRNWKTNDLGAAPDNPRRLPPLYNVEVHANTNNPPPQNFFDTTDYQFVVGGEYVDRAVFLSEPLRYNRQQSSPNLYVFSSQ